MAFRVVNWEEGKTVLIAAAATITFVKGNAVVDNGSGFLTNATGGNGTQIEYISDQSLTTGAATGELLRVYRVGPHIRINAEVDLATAQGDVGTYCDLAGAGSLNPNATTDKLFYIESIDLQGGAVGTSTQVFGYFTGGVPNAE